ncbi:MAG: InlB B-repeat-containing protein [Planctomycetota bacterium]|jgi:hypothetical protein
MYKKLLFLTTFVLVSGIISSSEGADEIFFTELFEDGNFSARGWYDNTSPQLSTVEYIPGSTSSAEYHFNVGATSPGGAMRKLFTPSESVYMSLYIKHSTNWTGSNVGYHPHQFHFLTNLDGAWIGPAYSFSTLYIETNEGEPLLALQDSKNIDEGNIGVDLTDITEERAIAGCNGNSDGTGNDDCYWAGTNYRNGKKWGAGSIYFQDSPGPYYKNDWHFIEAYFQMNSIVDGNGVADGQIKYWYDGELIIDHENVMLRTGENPTMKYNQFLIAPYIGVGSPVDQTFWVDDLTIANYRVGSYLLTVNSGSGDGSYEENEVVAISADVISGLTFAEWTGDTAGIANIFSANTTITMPAQDVTITATYTGTQTYLLTVNSGSGDGLYEAGQVVPVAADAAAPGEEFSHWAGDTAGVADVNLASTTITMPPQPTTITAIYKPLGGSIVTKEFGDAVNSDYPGSVADTWSRAGFSTNFSSDVQLNTYTWPDNVIANDIIIKWDLSAIPPDATVTEATLYLYQTGSGEDLLYDLPVHKIINVNPDISTLSWETYNGVNSWTGGADGGQSDIAAAEDTQAVNITSNEYKSWSVAGMVQDWVTNPSSNFGMMVNSDAVATRDSCRYFASSEVADNTRRPKLIVTYATVLTGDSEPDGDVDFDDFAEFALHWGETGCTELNGWCGGADFNHLDDVNLDDLKGLTDNWLAGVE